jgi:hypothetical protein
LRELNAALHAVGDDGPRSWRVLNPRGAHALAAGLDASIEVDIEGHAGYYCAGMNKRATVRVHGNAGVGVAENIMSGSVIVEGGASQSAGATGLGADCVEKELRDEDRAEIAHLLRAAEVEDADPSEFRRYGSARTLYNFHVDNAGAY